MKRITVQELNKLVVDGKKPYILDVRTIEEFQLSNIGGLNIPLNNIAEFIGRESFDLKIYCLCHHGVRSSMAIDFLSQSGYTDLTNIEGGIDAWSLMVDPDIPRY